jgi:hypothetical protein
MIIVCPHADAFFERYAADGAPEKSGGGPKGRLEISSKACENR